MKLKYLLFQVIMLCGCSAVYAAGPSQADFNLPSMNAEGVKALSGYVFPSIEKVSIPEKLQAKANASMMNINMDLTHPTRRGVAGEDRANKLKIEITLPDIGEIDENLQYNFISDAPGISIWGVVESGFFNWRYFYVIETKAISLTLSSKPSDVGLSGGLTGAVDGHPGNIKLNLSRTDSIYHPVYTLTGEGFDLTLKDLKLSGTISEDKYNRWTVSAILPLVIMLGLE